MRSDELRQAIEGPASEMALYFEPANLVDRLTDEVGQMPGALPLLSFTLSELYVKLAEKWRNQETSDRALTIDAQFDQEGGVAGSLTRRANEEYQKIGADPDLGEAGQLTMRRVMLRMLTLEGGETARRRVPDSELVYPTQKESDRVKQVVDRLVNARLLVRGQLETGEPYVEPAHDFLVRGWGLLQSWINAERETLALQQRLTAQASDWDKNNGPLLQGDRLNQLEKVLQQSHNWLNSKEIDFITNSIEHRNTERENVRKLQVESQLKQKSDIASQLLPVRPLDGLVLAIQTIGLNLEQLPEKILSPVQGVLSSAIEAALETKLYRGHVSGINSIVYSKDGKWFVSCGNDRNVCLWNAVDCSLIHIFKGHEAEATSVSISSDQRWIVSSSRDRKVCLWDVESHSLVYIFEGHTDEVYSVAFSPDGQWIVSGSRDGRVCLWCFETYSLNHVFEEHEGIVQYVAFDPSSNKLAVGVNPKGVYLWDINTYSLIHIFEQEGRIFNFSDDGRTLAIVHNTISLWDVETRYLFNSIPEGALSVAFSSDSKWLISGAGDCIKLWSSGGSKSSLVKTFRGHQSTIHTLAFSPDNRQIISGSNDATIRLWCVESQASIRSFVIVPDYGSIGGYMTSLVVSRDTKWIVSGSHPNQIELRNIDNPLLKRQFTEKECGLIQSVALVPNTSWIVSGGDSDKNTVCLWNANQGSLVRVLQEHQDKINSVAASPDGKWIVSGSYTGTIRLWNLEQSCLAHTFEIPETAAYSVAFSPDGRQIVIGTGGSSGKIVLFDVESLSLLYSLEAHSGYVYCVAFSENGKWIASSGVDKTVCLWDVDTHSLIYRFIGHEAPVYSVVFNSNDEWIASGSGDLTVRLWDTRSKSLIHTIKHQSEYETHVIATAFCTDGTIMSGSRDGTIQLSRCHWKSWLEACCDRLRHHPVFTNPELIEDLEQREIAIAACKTCQKYVWNVEDEAD